MKVLEIDPKNAATHVALGNLYNDQNQRGLAENQFRAAWRSNPTATIIMLDFGEILRQEGKTAEAEDQIRTAIGLNPKDAQAHLALANLLGADAGPRGRSQRRNRPSARTRSKLVPAPAASTAASRRRRRPRPRPRRHRASAPKIKPLNKLFLLTKNSSVYQNPDADQSAYWAGAASKKYVHVTGITGRLSADQVEERKRWIHPGGGGGIERGHAEQSMR